MISEQTKDEVKKTKKDVLSRIEKIIMKSEWIHPKLRLKVFEEVKNGITNK